MKSISSLVSMASLLSFFLLADASDAANNSGQAKRGAPPAASVKRNQIAFGGAVANASINKPPFVNGHYVLGPTMRTNGYHSFEPVVVVVDKGSHFTHVLQLQGSEIVRIMTVSNSIGSKDSPTPPGRYWVIKKVLNPCWTPPKNIDPEQKPVQPYDKDKRNGLGVAKISLNKFDIVLHGTNAPNKIRKDVSHGCVRHSNADIMRLYGLVKPGTVVYIVNKWRGKVLNQQDFKINTKKR